MIVHRGSIETKSEMLESLQQAPILSVDTETISLKDQTCIGIGIQWSDTDSLYCQVFPKPDAELPTIMDVLSGSPTIKIYFNGLFDLRVLYELSQRECLAEPDEYIEDASIASQVQGYADHSLDDLSELLLGYRNEYSIQELLAETKAEGISSPTMLDVDQQKLAIKCMNDCKATWDLWHHLSKTWPNSRNKDCYDVDCRVLPILLSMERKGLRLRPSLVREHYEQLRGRVMAIESECSAQGFAPGSGQQVGYILASLGFILPFTKSRTRRQLRTDEDVLESIEHPIAKLVLDYRHDKKLLSTYIEPWLDCDRAYTHFRLDLSTGRLASFQRNLQNIPPDMRAIFGPDSTYFSWADYSQVEMRIFGYLAKDPEIMRAYKDGRNIHELTMSELFPYLDSTNHDLPQYTTSKTFNFAMIYFANVGTLAKHTKVDVKVCAGLRNRWLRLYEGGYKYMIERMADESPIAESDFGRRMALPILGPDGRPVAQSHIDKCKINYPVQGTAADIIKRAMLVVGDECDLRLQVHDELVVDGEYDFPETLSRIHPGLETPLEQKRDFTWT